MSGFCAQFARLLTYEGAQAAGRLYPPFLAAVNGECADTRQVYEDLLSAVYDTIHESSIGLAPWELSAGDLDLVAPDQGEPRPLPAIGTYVLVDCPPVPERHLRAHRGAVPESGIDWLDLKARPALVLEHAVPHRFVGAPVSGRRPRDMRARDVAVQPPMADGNTSPRYLRRSPLLFSTSLIRKYLKEANAADLHRAQTFRALPPGICEIHGQRERTWGGPCNHCLETREQRERRLAEERLDGLRKARDAAIAKKSASRNRNSVTPDRAPGQTAATGSDVGSLKSTPLSTGAARAGEAVKQAPTNSSCPGPTPRSTNAHSVPGGSAPGVPLTQVTLGVRASGHLAKRSARLLGGLVGRDRRDLARMTEAEIRALLLDLPIEVTWVPATEL